MYKETIEGFRIIRDSKLFRQSWDKPTSIQIILWWELRRVVYNLVMLFVGIILSFLVVAINIVAKIAFNGSCYIPATIFTIFFFALIANFFYTGGWFVQIFVRIFKKDWSRVFGEKAFAAGMLFSIIITIFLFFIVILTSFSFSINVADVPGTYISNVKDRQMILIIEPNNQYFQYYKDDKTKATVGKDIWSLYHDDEWRISFEGMYYDGYEGSGNGSVPIIEKMLIGRQRIWIEYDLGLFFYKVSPKINIVFQN